MVEFVAAALIVSGFWVLLELGRFILAGLSKEDAAVELSVAPGREYVERYADAFRRLAESYQEMPKRKEYFGDEEVEHIFERMRERVCSHCPQGGTCWGERYYETGRELWHCLREIETTDADGALPSSFNGIACEKAEEFLPELKEAFLHERENLMWSNRLLEQRATAGEQIQDTAKLMQQMAERIYQIRGLRQSDFRRLKKELRYEKIQCKNAWIFCREQTRPELYVTMRIEDGNCIQTRDLTELLTPVIGERMVPAKDCRLTVKREYDTFHYVTDTKYQMLCGIARMTKEGELVSGDNFAFWQGDCGQLIMSLADGMGTGVAACRESEKVIELLEQFLDAGFSQDTAMRMINSSMVLQDHMKIFSTIDLCMVDLYSGNCSLMKAGACTTYIRREDTVEAISCGTLPAGILQAADYETTQRTLLSGNMVIMMTDGVADALPEENREARMEELILKIRTNNTKEFAARLLEQILIQQKLQVRDDMTVLVGQIWEK